MRLYKEVRKRCPKVALMRLDLTNVSEILKAIENSEREKLDEKRRAKMRYLKEQARHFVPYVPKLTNTPNLGKQSSVSVLQSFTSAVQQLCSPEKTPTKTSSHPSKAVVALEQRSESRIQSQIPESRNQTVQNQIQESRIQNQIPESRNQNQESRPLHPSNMARSEAGGDGVAVKRATKPASQCIDLIILSDSDEEMERNHIR